MRWIFSVFTLILSLNASGAPADTSSVLNSSTAAAEFAAGAKEFDAYRAEKLASISSPRHAPYALLQGHKTEYSVLLIHGIFESPYYLHGISQAFAAKGMNVVTILLSGHWAKNPKDIDQVTYQDWRNNVIKGYAMASKMGEHVLLAGYSLGGLLSMDFTFSNPSKVSGLFLWAPALVIQPLDDLAATAGTLFGISGNDHFDAPVDGVLVPYLSPKAGLEIEMLGYDMIRRNASIPPSVGKSPPPNPIRIRESAYAKLTVPLFLVSADGDEAVMGSESVYLYNSYLGPKDFVHYDRSQPVDHLSTPKSKLDRNPANPSDINPFFDSMIQEMDQFIDRVL